MVIVHATNGDMIDYLIAKHRSEGKLTPVYHYLSQPEVTEAEASVATTKALVERLRDANIRWATLLRAPNPNPKKGAVKEKLTGTSFSTDDTATFEDVGF